MVPAGVFTRVDSASVTQLTVTLALPLMLVALAFRAPSARYVQRWAANRDLELTDANRPLVHAYIMRTRRLRTIGGALGFLIADVPGSLYNLVDPASELGRTLLRLASGSWSLVSIIVGYLIGALVAELSLARPRGGQRARAALVPREVKQYATPWARTGLWVLAATLVAAVPLPAILTFEQNSSMTPSVARYAKVAVLGIAVVLVVEWLQRMIVRRPQSFVDPDVVEADDAVRSSSVHACLGVGLTILMSLAGSVLMEISSGAIAAPVHWILGLPAIVCVLGSVTIWLGFGTSYGWAVRRRPVAGPPQSPTSHASA